MPATAGLTRLAVALFTEPDNSTATASGARLDKWLWAVRMFKSRSLATDACRAGSVDVSGQAAKPGRDVHAGELVTLRQGVMTRTLRVVGVPRTRVGAKLVAEFYADLTPAAEFDKMRQHSLQHVLAREKGSGRPTKRERRTIDRLFGG